MLATQVSYPAELAGLHYGVRATVAGLLISVYGYSDTLATLAQASFWCCWPSQARASCLLLLLRRGPRQAGPPPLA